MQLAGSPAWTSPCGQAGALLWEQRKGLLFQASWSRGEEQDPDPLESQRWGTVLSRLASALASREQS